MPLSTRPRRTSSRIDIVRSWLASPLSRLVVTPDTRNAIQWLVDEASTLLPAGPADQAPAPAHLQRRPRIGTPVRLLRTDPFLEREAGAVIGSTGTVVDHSKLNWDDDGVLIDWGNGRRIRSDLVELALVE